MTMTKKTKKTIIIVTASVLTAVILAVGVFLLWFFVFNKVNTMEIDINNLSVYMADDFTVGNRIYDGDGTKSSFDLVEFFPDAAHSYGLPEATTVVSLSGSVLTVTGTGAFKLKVDGSTYNATAVDAVNVVTFDQFYKAVSTQTPVVLQKNLELQDLTKAPYELEGKTIFLKSDVYGNGHKIVCTAAVNGYYDVAFSVEAENVTMQDIQIVGYVVENSTNFKLQDFDKYGILINVTSGADNYYGLNLKNSILENANRLILASHAKLNIEGSFFQNAADSCISVASTSNGASAITMKNNVIRNATVAGIHFWGETAITEKDYNRVDIEGFLDVYNWKANNNIEIIPRSGGFFLYSVNGLIQDTINNGDYEDFFYNHNNKKYIHFGIMIMGTGGLKNNGTEIYDNGVKMQTETSTAGNNYQQRKMPLPAAAEQFAFNMCNIYGYVSNPLILPGEIPEDNIFLELRNGRV